MDDAKKMWRMRASVWDFRRDDNAVSQRLFTDVPDVLVHYLLGCTLLALGGSVDCLDHRTAVSIDLCFTIGEEELPF